MTHQLLRDHDVVLTDGELRLRPRAELWLDTSCQSPAETVDSIIARGWNEGRVR
jgi:hypothetical protein